ncbi:MAG: glycosyltransferase, partial [Prevotella sp.]|nr:glycosyltransferase [Prevotella sp.]
VVQFIPKSQNVGTTASYAETLVEQMDKYADTTLTTTLAQLKKTTKETSPDIIHIHGCWSLLVARAQHWAEEQGLPVVITLHGGLQPWQWQASGRVSNTLRRFAFLEKAVRQADAIHVHGEMELRRMKKLGWNSRLAIVRNALVTNQITASSMALQMVRLYQKVIDSNTFRLMTDEEKRTESLLLRIALDHENRATSTFHQQPISSLSEDSWRKILIHANDEHILDYIQLGADLLFLDIANIDTTAVDRFPQKLQKPDGTLPTDHLLARHALKTKSKLDHLRQDEKPSDTEMAICHLLFNVQFQLRHDALSRRHLSQLFALLRYSDYNEDRISRMLQQLKLLPFASRLLQIFHDSLALEEGFMPIEPRADKGTHTIQKQLHAMNIQDSIQIVQTPESLNP